MHSIIILFSLFLFLQLNLDIIFICINENSFIVDLSHIDYESFTCQQKSQWKNAAAHSHQHAFDYYHEKNNGVPMWEVWATICQDFNDYNVSEIYAKGPYLEKRLMSRIAVNGTFSTKKSIQAGLLNYDDYKFIDLNNYNVQKYPHNKHDPLDECFFFFKQIKSQKI